MHNFAVWSFHYAFFYRSECLLIELDRAFGTRTVRDGVRVWYPSGMALTVIYASCSENSCTRDYTKIWT